MRLSRSGTFPLVAIFFTLAVEGCRSAPVMWEAVSPDVRAAIRVTPRGDLACVSINGRPNGCYDGVNLPGIVFSEAGGATAVPVLRGDRWHIVWNGVPGTEWEAVGPPVLSPDGTRLAYAAFADGGWRIVVDELAGLPGGEIVSGSIRFDPSGRRLAYATRLGRFVHVVVDGEFGPGWDAVTGLEFSATGDRLAYLAQTGGGTRLVVDGLAGEPQSEIGHFALGRSASAVGFSVRDSSGWYVSDGEKRYGPFTGVRALSYRDEVMSFIGVRENGEAVFVAGAPHRWHSSVDAPAFDSIGRRWGYIANEEDSAFVYLDGALLRGEGGARDLAISADGRRHAYVAATSSGLEVVDEGARYPFDMVIEGTLQFLPSGSWAALAGDPVRRRLYVVVDGWNSGRQLDWSQLIRLAEGPEPAIALRRWVATATAGGAVSGM